MDLPLAAPSGRAAADLVEQVRGGSMEALGALYGQFAPALYRVAYRFLGSREEAEDVIHDVFVGLPEALSGYTEVGRFESWLKRVTVRVALRRLRASRRIVGLELSDLVGAAEAPDALDCLALKGAIERLPASLRAVMLLRLVEGYAHHEIAGLLGISEGASRVRLLRAVKLIRREMGSR